MKLKHLLLCALLLITVRSFAQNTVTSIRKSYNSVQQRIKDMRAGEFPPSTIDVTLTRNLPGTGPSTVKYFICFTDDYDYESANPTNTLTSQFVTLSYNYAAREYYEEYLYDDNENLIFAYSRYPSDDMEMMLEARVYLDGDKVVSLLMKQKKNDAKQFEQIYNGAKVPNEYNAKVEELRQRGKNNIQLTHKIYYNL